MVIFLYLTPLLVKSDGRDRFSFISEEFLPLKKKKKRRWMCMFLLIYKIVFTKKMKDIKKVRIGHLLYGMESINDPECMEKIKDQTNYTVIWHYTNT